VRQSIGILGDIVQAMLDLMPQRLRLHLRPVELVVRESTAAPARRPRQGDP